jgi:hypothetical protein
VGKKTEMPNTCQWALAGMTAAGSPKGAMSGFLLGEERAIQNLKAKMLKSGIFVNFEPFVAM